MFLPGTGENCSRLGSCWNFNVVRVSVCLSGTGEIVAAAKWSIQCFGGAGIEKRSSKSKKNKTFLAAKSSYRVNPVLMRLGHGWRSCGFHVGYLLNYPQNQWNILSISCLGRFVDRVVLEVCKPKIERKKMRECWFREDNLWPQRTNERRSRLVGLCPTTKC